MMMLALFLAASTAVSAGSAYTSPEPRRDGCQYRKVSLKTQHGAALLQSVFEDDPLEGWLTLDGQPCTPSSKFHWHPSATFPTVKYPPVPVEVSTLARVADVKAQKAYLRSFQGLSDVTARDIQEALHGEVPSPAPAAAPAPLALPVPPVPVASPVESANTRTRSFEIEALPPVGQVQLVNAKADMQQAILTAALGARAQIQGKVDASDHMRAELLHGLNVSLESAMAQEQSTLQRSEANVAETARKAVDGTLTSVLKASMDKVLGVGLAAASLTSEAETLQGNATALLDQVEAEASSGEVQRLPSSALVEQRIRQVEGEVQEMRQEAAAAEGGAGAALEEMEKALEVVHRSATKAEKAKALRGRAAEQAAKNAAEIRRIRLQLTGGAPDA